jgi:hypothetical protein
MSLLFQQDIKIILPSLGTWHFLLYEPEIIFPQFFWSLSPFASFSSLTSATPLERKLFQTALSKISCILSPQSPLFYFNFCMALIFDTTCLVMCYLSTQIESEMCEGNHCFLPLFTTVSQHKGQCQTYEWITFLEYYMLGLVLHVLLHLIFTVTLLGRYHHQ